MTGNNALARRNRSEAAVNDRLVRHTIVKNGQRFLSAPTRSMKDRVFGKGSPRGVPVGNPRATRPLLLYALGIQGDSILGRALMGDGCAVVTQDQGGCTPQNYYELPPIFSSMA